MVKHTLEILNWEHRKILKAYLAIFERFAWKG